MLSKLNIYDSNDVLSDLLKLNGLIYFAINILLKSGNEY